MLFIKNTKPPFTESLAETLESETKAGLTDAFHLMGRRFIGKPRKVSMAHGIARYVLEHPLDVLHRLDAESLMHIKNLLLAGKGNYIVLPDMEYYNTLQRMGLVLTYEDRKSQTMRLYMLDELHDAFGPVIDEAYKHPSPVLEADMVKGLQHLAEEWEKAEDIEAYQRQVMNEFAEMEMMMTYQETCSNLDKMTQTPLEKMSDTDLVYWQKELDIAHNKLRHSLSDYQKANPAPDLVESVQNTLSMMEKMKDMIMVVKAINKLQSLPGFPRKRKR